MLKKQYRVLIVEDEKLFRDAIVCEFERKGFLVYSAPNGIEAYKFLQIRTVDVVVTDIVMPEGNGIDLLEKIKARHPKLPTIMLMTGFSEITSSMAQAKGADALFTKPFDRKALVEVVYGLLDQKNELPKRSYQSLQINFGARSQKLNGWISSGKLNEIFGCLTGSFPELGDTVGLELLLDNTMGILRLNGSVKWISFAKVGDLSPGIGIELLALTDLQKKKINTFIDCGEC